MCDTKCWPSVANHSCLYNWHFQTKFCQEYSLPDVLVYTTVKCNILLVESVYEDTSKVVYVRPY